MSARGPNSRHHRPAEILGALAAAGALGLTAPAAVGNACPDHDGGNSSGAASSGNSNVGAGSESAGKATQAKSTSTAGGAKAGPAGGNSKNQGSDPLCPGGPSGSAAGACGTPR